MKKALNGINAIKISKDFFEKTTDKTAIARRKIAINKIITIFFYPFCL